MTIEFIKVAAPMVGAEEVEAVSEVILSGKYVSGTKVETFETQFSEYIGVDYAIAVNSGTAALHIALEALGIKKGDEVIVSPLTFFASISSVLYLRAIPVFADVDIEDLCLSPESVRSKITSKTKAVMPVHLFGASAKMDLLVNLSAEYKIPIVEDCAQAHGTEYDGNKVGSFGAAGAFSFFATKHMTTGEGGIITTNDSRLAEFAKSIRNHGMVNRDQHMVLGYNHRMTEIEAAMGLVQLKKLDNLNKKRIENSEFLLGKIKELPWALIPVPPQDRVKHTYFWCPIMVDQSFGKSVEDLKVHLEENGIGFRHRYNEPLYKQTVLRKISPIYSQLYLDNAEKVAGQIIGLPNHPGLKQEELDRIVEILFKF